MKNINLFCLLMVIYSCSSLSMLTSQEKKEALEDSDYEKIQKAFSDVVAQKIHLFAHVELLTKKSLEHKYHFNQEEHLYFSETREKVYARMNDTHHTLGKVRAIEKNDPAVLIQMGVHLSYAQHYIADANQLLEKFEKLLNERIPRAKS